jgi:hypothetical protein
MRLVLFLSLVALVSGCSFSGEVVNLDQANVSPMKKARGAEFVSGAANKVITTGNYTVTHTVGATHSQIKVKTSGGYQVYMSLQGQVFAENKTQ